MNQLLIGDCRHLLLTFPDNYFDSCVIDTPYELGFMGKAWDKTGIAYDVPTWQQVRRVLKPGAYLLAFGGSRTYHRIASAIEDAGFEIRDQIMWVYGSGFPKSLDVSKAIDKAAGAERAVVGNAQDVNGRVRAEEANAGHSSGFGTYQGARTITAPATAGAQQWAGWGTALKPAHEPICVARKPLEKGLTVVANVLKWGTGALNVDGCRVMHLSEADRQESEAKNQHNGRPYKPGLFDISSPRTNYEAAAGRWPANLIHDSSDEVVALFPQTATAAMKPGTIQQPTAGAAFGKEKQRVKEGRAADAGSAARFFYCAKASTAERGPGNDHPCVKPQALLRYLARLVTPRGGRILDHYTGSGSGPLAFTAEGFSWVAMDLDPHNIAIAESRLAIQRSEMGLFASAAHSVR